MAERALALLCAALWLCTQGLWLLARDGAVGAMPLTWWAAWVLGGVLLIWTVWRWRAGKPSQLVWSGQVSAGPHPGAGWTLAAPGQLRGWSDLRLHCLLDTNRYMLLRLAGPRGRVRWVWCSQTQQPSDWGAFRRAVFASGRAP